MLPIILAISLVCLVLRVYRLAGKHSTKLSLIDRVARGEFAKLAAALQHLQSWGAVDKRVVWPAVDQRLTACSAPHDVKLMSNEQAGPVNLPLDTARSKNHGTCYSI